MIYFIKAIFVFGLLAGGIFFLLTGLGVQIPFVAYKGLEAHNVPAGAILLAAGIALAAFWKVSSSQTIEESSTTTTADGSTTTTKKKTTSSQFFPPNDF
jgi:hypothetical protein